MAIIIPCYGVKAQILSVLDRIGDRVDHIVVVDDACPEGTGDHVLANCHDPRVKVLFHSKNQGVGGAILTGYRYAAEKGADVMVKLDGDGQMDPAIVDCFIRPIVSGDADYTKGNRFYNIEDVRTMPPLRLVGNAVLSFLTKLSSGYWNIFDPTNGYTAISTSVFQHLPVNKLSRRYFFESDMLFRLGTVRACVVDVPMRAMYADEKSGIRVGRIWPQFLLRNVVNTLKRLAYNYFLRDFTVASLEIIFGIVFLLFGIVFGAHGWIVSARSGVVASDGTVMLAALPIIVGVQLLLTFLAYDISAVPSRAIHPVFARQMRSPYPEIELPETESAPCSR